MTKVARHPSRHGDSAYVRTDYRPAGRHRLGLRRDPSATMSDLSADLARARELGDTLTPDVHAVIVYRFGR